MNIMELKIGECGVADGILYTVKSEAVEPRPGLGRVRIITAEDQLGFVHKFIRGIEVERV